MNVRWLLGIGASALAALASGGCGGLLELDKYQVDPAEPSGPGPAGSTNIPPDIGSEGGAARSLGGERSDDPPLPVPQNPAAAPSIGVGRGVNLTPNENGIVLGTTNGLGIQGDFYTFTDATGSGGMSTIQPDTTARVNPGTFAGAVSEGSVCVHGTGAQIPMDPDDPNLFDYGHNYGAWLGLNLARPLKGGFFQNSEPWAPVVPGQRSVRGFRFTLTGPLVPVASMNFGVGVLDETGTPDFERNVCRQMPAPVSDGSNDYEVQLADLTSHCYAMVPDPFARDTPLLSIEWHVFTHIEAPTPFDFCVSNLRALLD